VSLAHFHRQHEADGVLVIANEKEGREMNPLPSLFVFSEKTILRQKSKIGGFCLVASFGILRSGTTMIDKTCIESTSVAGTGGKQ
jgi:hypothetical protein